MWVYLSVELLLEDAHFAELAGFVEFAEFDVFDEQITSLCIYLYGEEACEFKVAWGAC